MSDFPHMSRMAKARSKERPIKKPKCAILHPEKIRGRKYGNRQD
jgi:hypothetical protein